jgi:hypothetical protein
MLKSKYFMIVMILTCLMLGAGVAFNALEMQDYNLFEALIARFSK